MQVLFSWGEYGAVGDYLGPNHILPTGGTARLFAGYKWYFHEPQYHLLLAGRGTNDADDIIRLADIEGLTAHANCLRVRKEGYV